MSFRIGDLYTLAMLFALAMFVLTNDGLAQRKFEMMKVVPSDDGAEQKPKFVSLLENKDLSHFRGYSSEEIPAGWEIKGKTVACDGKGSGDIITKEIYRDFELQVEWNIEKGGNSGIMFRVTLGDDQPYYSGPEFQIFDDGADSNEMNDLTSAGALYDLYPAKKKKVNAAGKWNKSRIIVNQNKITHFLNGVKVVEVESGSDDWNERLAKSKFKDWEKFNKSEEGHIAFQNHGSAVQFRNIRIKRMGDLQADPAAVGGPVDADAPVVPPSSGRNGRAPGPIGADEAVPEKGVRKR